MFRSAVRHYGSGSYPRLATTVAVLVGVVSMVATPSALGAPPWGDIATPTGPEERVFDWSTMACESLDIPDSSANAFRDSSGRVQLIASHYSTRRMIGPSLTNMRRDCKVLMRSQFNPDPATFEDREWVGAPYTEDGETIYGLLSNEHEGWNHPGQCPAPYIWKECWTNALTLGVSTDGGDSYSHTAGPSHLVASIPYTYAPSVDAYGMFDPTNIVKKSDGYYYVMAKQEDLHYRTSGTCLLRTRDLSDASSWRAWDGSTFSVSFINPYVEQGESPASHVCEPVSPTAIATMSGSITYSSYFGKYMLVGSSGWRDETTGATTDGFFYSLSDDLINWSVRKLLLEAELPWTHVCGEPDPVLYPAIIDPDSTSRNFETMDQEAYLYFTRQHYIYNGPNCYQGLDRDLVRVPLQFSNGGAGPASASVTVAPGARPAAPTDTTDTTGTTEAAQPAVAPAGPTVSPTAIKKSVRKAKRRSCRRATGRRASRRSVCVKRLRAAKRVARVSR
jgi:hypothetical protein